MWKIQLFKLNFDSREVDAARQVVESGWLTMGEETRRFESAFTEFLGGEVESIAVANCTAALHLSLMALGVQEGDEVVIPSLTFVADANVTRLVGATPVLADCASLGHWNISAETIERAMTAKTKAVIAVHYAGFPCDMPAISKLCRDRGVGLIEDVAHAPGAEIAGRSCGTWGDIGCFSFFSNKNLSIGEGGMVTSTNPALAEKLRLLRSHGMTTLTLDRHKGRATSYDVAESGLNYRMDEIRAAIGLVQLDKLGDGNLRRKQLTDLYRQQLATDDISVPFQEKSDSSISSYHIMPVLLPEGCDRGRVMSTMKDAGIQTSIHYPPIWGFKAYEKELSAESCPNSAVICARELTLPLYPTMTNEEVVEVCTALRSAIN